jgi:hypothetical protein
MHGNPWLRLLRREVETLVRERYGANYLRNRQAKTELARINRELKRLKGHGPEKSMIRQLRQRSTGGLAIRLAIEQALEGVASLVTLAAGQVKAA